MRLQIALSLAYSPLLGMRQRADLSLRQAAGRIGCSHVTLSRLERGHIGASADLIDKIASAYGVDRFDVFEALDQIPPEIVAHVRDRGAGLWRALLEGKA